MKVNLANFITSLRIFFSFVLLFLTPLSPAFLFIYILAGLTDMTDGTVARMTDSVTEEGSKLDTLADIVFTSVSLIKLLPVLYFPVWAYRWTAGIALIKAVSLVSGYIMHRKFAAVHSIPNKIAGAMLFALPLTLTFIDLRYSTAAVCSMATFAALHEGHFILTNNEKSNI